MARMAFKEGTGNQDFSTGTVVGFPFFRESLQKKNSIVHPDVIIGSREEVSERTRFGPNFYGGWVVMNLTPGHASTIFPWILGADAVGTTFSLAETLQAFSVLVDKVTGVHEWYDGYVNRAIIHGKQNGPGGAPNWITVAVQCFFKSYLGPGSSEAYPTLTLGTTGEFAPLVFEDAVLTLGNASKEAKEFTLDINNYLQPRYVNNLDPTQLCPRHRTIKLSVRLPYDSGTSGLYGLAITGAASANTLAITNGTVSITATFGAVQAPSITPVVNGKQEIDLLFEADIRKVSSTSSLTFVVDSTV